MIRKEYILSLKTMNNSIMTIKIVYDAKKNQLCRKIRSDGNLLLSLYMNFSITEKFPTKHFPKMMDSDIKKPE